MALEEELGLDISGALRAIDDLETRGVAAAASIAAAIETQLAAAVAGVDVPPVDVTVDVDTSQVDGATADIGGMVDTAGDIPPVDVQVDASQVVDAAGEVEGLAETLAGVDGETVEVNVDTSSVASAAGDLDATTDAAGRATGGFAETAASAGAMGAEIGLMNGTLSGAVAGFAGFAGAIGYAANAALEASKSGIAAKSAFGDLAPELEKVSVAGLKARSLSELALSLGADDDKVRSTAAAFGILAQQSGVTADQAVGLSKNLYLVAASLVAANPNLGTLDEVMGRLQPALARGGNFAAKLGLDIGSAAEIADAASAKFGKPVDQLSQFERSAAGLDVAMQRLGPSIGKSIQDATEQPVFLLARLKTALEEAAEAAGGEFADDLVRALVKLEPILVDVIAAFGKLASGGLSVLEGGLEVLGPPLEALAWLLERIPSPVLEAAGGFVVAAKAAQAFSGPLSSLLGMLATVAGRAGAQGAAAAFQALAGAQAASAAAGTEAAAAGSAGLLAFGPLALVLGVAAGAMVLFGSASDDTAERVKAAGDAVTSYREQLGLTNRELAQLDAGKARREFEQSGDAAGKFIDKLGEEDEEWPKIFDRVGVSSRTLTEALHGNAKAVEEVRRKFVATGELDAFPATGDPKVRKDVIADLIKFGDVSTETAAKYGDAIGTIHRGGIVEEFDAQVKAARQLTDQLVVKARAEVKSGDAASVSAIADLQATGQLSRLGDEGERAARVLLEKADAQDRDADRSRDAAVAAGVVADGYGQIAAAAADALRQLEAGGNVDAGGLGALRDLAADPVFTSLPKATQDIVKATLDQADAARDAAGAQGSLVSEFGETTDALDRLNDQLDKTLARLKELRGEAPNTADSARNLNVAISELPDQIAKTGGTSLKFDPKASAAERKATDQRIDAVGGLISKAQEYGDQVLQETGSVDQAVAAATSYINALREQAKALGLNSDEVEFLIGMYRALPDQLRTDYTLSGAGDAAGKIAAVDQAVKLLPPDAQTRVEAKVTGEERLAQLQTELVTLAESNPTAALAIIANLETNQYTAELAAALKPQVLNVIAKVTPAPQGWVDDLPRRDRNYRPATGPRFAAGGVTGRMVDRVPTSGLYAGRGDGITFAEASTSGEYFISRDRAHRGRNIGLVESAANEFGFDLVPRGVSAAPVGSVDPRMVAELTGLRADVAALAAVTTAQTSSVVAAVGGIPTAGDTVNHFEIVSPSPEDAAFAVADRQRLLAAGK